MKRLGIGRTFMAKTSRAKLINVCGKSVVFGNRPLMLKYWGTAALTVGIKITDDRIIARNKTLSNSNLNIPEPKIIKVILWKIS